MSFRDGPCRCGAATYREPRFMGRRMARRCEDCNLIVGRCDCRVSLIVHLCPPGDAALMPCCGISPHERMGDRMTLDPRRVTCPFYSTDAPGLPHSIEERIADDNGDELERGEPDYAGQ